MKNKTGVAVKKTKFCDKQVKTDFQKIFTNLSKAAISYFAGKPDNAFKDLVGIVEGFELSFVESVLQLNKNSHFIGN